MLIVLPKLSSLSDEFNSSQLKVVYMEDYQIEETAFFPIYIWTTSVLSQINSSVTCQKSGYWKYLFPPCQLSRRLMGEIDTFSLAKLISKASHAKFCEQI